MTTPQPADGVSAMVRQESMCASAGKLRDYYARVPGAPLFRREFGYYCLERWYEQGLDRDANMDELFGYDEPGHHQLMQLSWCEAAFEPAFEDKVLEDRGDY
ncbi:MAG: hypothetical protein HQ546_07115, partial [Planctomycetes bacterium]|nr:hypothetical protein [Planctomycetota bacterium]